MTSTGPTRVQNIEIDEESVGQRLDNFLVKLLKGLPKSRIYRIIRKGEVRINGKRCKPHTKLVAGDIVRIPPIVHLQERHQSVGNFRDLDSLILFENDHLLIINKPAGMAVHGGSGVSVGVIESLRHALPDGNRLELVHRLDRGTSGCLMVAKKRSYLRLLQDALRKPGQISKDYVTVVHGAWPEKVRAVNEPLMTVSNAGSERVTRVNPEGKAALTRFRSLAQSRALSLVKASPVTGRTHQIRVHARWARHPIVGDDRYGDAEMDRVVKPGTTRLLLHAAQITIPALADHAAIRVQARVDKDFESVMRNHFKFDNDTLIKTIS
jgi:23S rRNA pseudouridine955/2504/2580 synthase